MSSAILIDSRVTGTARPDSDWDIAIQWSRGIDFFQQLAATEKLRWTLAKTLAISEQAVDLIDLPTARLTTRAVVAEEGLPLKGDGSLAWHRFLQRTWRELEEYYWEQTYAACYVPIYHGISAGADSVRHILNSSILEVRPQRLKV